MKTLYRVLDCRDPSVAPVEINIEAVSAIDAGEKVLGEKLSRGDRSTRTLRAKVYFRSAPETAWTMVRLYAANESVRPRRTA